jgi:lipopolysaccharide/colanic/teichoic acid biosynthesis glycosyltransferase
MCYETAKRYFDICLSAITLALLSPLLLIAAIAIKCDSQGPSIYRGLRMGRNGRIFAIYKFRSMISDADRGSPVTTEGDTRITRLGRILRRWKIDELPNLINIFMGDMSFVGPRPESPVYVNYYTATQRQVFSVRPGIACLAQIRYPNEESLLKGEELNERTYLQHMANKLELDLLYVETSSFWGDLAILVCTFLAVFGIKIDLTKSFQRNHLCHLDLG